MLHKWYISLKLTFNSNRINIIAQCDVTGTQFDLQAWYHYLVSLALFDNLELLSSLRTIHVYTNSKHHAHATYQCMHAQMILHDKIKIASLCTLSKCCKY